MAIAYALVVLGTLGFAAGRPVPSAGTLVEGLGWSLLVDLTVCAVAVGLASVTLSRPATITALIGFQLIASPMLLQARALGVLAALVMLAWVLLSAALGLWRTCTPEMTQICVISVIPLRWSRADRC